MPQREITWQIRAEIGYLEGAHGDHPERERRCRIAGWPDQMKLKWRLLRYRKLELVKSAGDIVGCLMVRTAKRFIRRACEDSAKDVWQCRTRYWLRNFEVYGMRRAKWHPTLWL